MAEADETTKKLYRGNCHCGAFIFEVRMPEIKEAQSCNCKICTKKGYMWIFPGDGLTIVKDDGLVKDYTFGPKNTHHKFCSKCGTPLMGYNANFPEGMQTAINARAIQDLDIWSLTPKPVDGANWGEPYETAPFTGTEPTAEVEGGKIYTGSCHCGAVRVAIKVKPLGDSWTDDADRILDCNCTICQRGAYIWIYPKSTQVSVQGEENLSQYVFGHRGCAKSFCKTCGVHVFNDRVNPTPEELAAMPPAIQGWVERMKDMRPVTLRVLDNFDLSTLKIMKGDGLHKIKSPYVNP